MLAFERYIGIDYSGAQTPTSSLPGLRIYQATPLQPAEEVLPPPSPRKYWTRRGIAQWLVQELASGPPALVGIDHGFSFPLKYFERHDLPLCWPEFLVDFRLHWPTDGDNIYVGSVCDGTRGKAAARAGDPRWRRTTELRARTAKSVFHFDVQGTVAHSTHAGLPWLLHLREHLGSKLHFWPFDGWEVPAHTPVIAEVYPALWNKSFPTESRTRDQQDAFVIAEWMRRTDNDGSLERFFQPKLDAYNRAMADVEGWILGVEV